MRVGERQARGRGTSLVQAGSEKIIQNDSWEKNGDFSSIKFRVEFTTRFTDAPVVQIGIAGRMQDKDVGSHFIEAVDVLANAFDIMLTVQNSSEFSGMIVNWMAIGSTDGVYGQ